MVLLLSLVVSSQLLANNASASSLTDDTVLQVLPTTQTTQLDTVRERWRNNPQNAGAAAALAQAYIQFARTESQPRFYGYAEGVIQPWLDQDDPPLSIQLLHATLLQNRHQFELAIATLKNVLQREPRYAQALLTLATIYQAQGEHAKALGRCLQLSQLALTDIASVCTAVSLAAKGSNQRAIALLKGIAFTDDVLEQWRLGLLAEIHDRRGAFDESDRYFQRALELGRNPRLLERYAASLLAANQPQRAIDLLDAETRDTSLLLQLALAKKAKNAGIPADEVAILKQRFEEQRLLDRVPHHRSLSEFHLTFTGETALAHKLASENWKDQREYADALLLYQTAQATNDTATLERMAVHLSAFRQ